MKFSQKIKYACIFTGLFYMQTTSALDIYVTANVIANTCTINNNNMIEVDFGSALLTNRIDGNNYRKNVPYTIDCSTGVPATIKLRIEGQGASFDSDVLASDQTALGIAFYQNGIAMPLNNKIDASYSNLPVLEAVPVKNPGESLIAGDFAATATLAVYYQ